MLKSAANGPGTRAVLWFQGCSFSCRGCFNEKMQDPHNGVKISPGELFNKLIIENEGIEGVTISGGEPFQQDHESLLDFLKLIKTNNKKLTIIVFTGYRYEEFEKFEYSNKFMNFIDVLITGRYTEELRVAKNLIGSSNKQIHILNSSYRIDDFQKVPPGEVIIGKNGSISITGIRPVNINQTSWRRV